MDKVKCPVCNKLFLSLMSHIRLGHKIKVEEFKKRYPDCVLVSKSTRKKLSVSISGENNPFYGKIHTDDTKTKMSENHADFTGDNNPFKKWYSVPENKKKFDKSRILSFEKRRLENSKEYIEMCNLMSQRVSKLHIDGKLFAYGRGHKNGYFFSERQKINIYFRSSYEERFLNLCEKIKHLKFISCNFYIKYNDDNQHVKRYIPDFILNDNIIVEVKPVNLLGLKSNKIKFKAGEKYCKNNNFHYIILTQIDLEKFEMDIQCLIDLLIKK